MRINNHLFSPVSYPVQKIYNAASQEASISTTNSTLLIDPYHNIAFLGKSKKYDKEIEAVEDNLAKMGINAYLQDKCDLKNLLIAKSVKEAFTDITNAGLHIPKGLSIHCDNQKESFEDNADAVAYTDVASNKREKPE